MDTVVTLLYVPQASPSTLSHALSHIYHSACASFLVSARSQLLRHPPTISRICPRRPRSELVSTSSLKLNTRLRAPRVEARMLMGLPRPDIITEANHTIMYISRRSPHPDGLTSVSTSSLNLSIRSCASHNEAPILMGLQPSSTSRDSNRAIRT